MSEDKRSHILDALTGKTGVRGSGGRASGVLLVQKSGLTSSPFLPQAEQVNLVSMSDNRGSFGHGSPLIAVQWLHR